MAKKWLAPPFKGGEGGRRPGSRNRFTKKFWELLAQQVDDHGADMLEIVRVEHPEVIVKLWASLMPRELEVSVNEMHETDQELDELAAEIRRRIEERKAQIIDVTPATEEVKVITDGRQRVRAPRKASSSD